MAYDVLIHRARLLSSPTRLLVWQCVGDMGAYAGDIARTLDIAASTASHHLAALTAAGLVRYTQQGRFRWYEATGERWAVVSEAELAAGVV